MHKNRKIKASSKVLASNALINKVIAAVAILVLILGIAFLVNGCGSSKPVVTKKEASKAKAKGLDYYKQGKWDESIKQFEKAVEGSPKDLQTHYQLAYAYNQKGDLDKAYTQFEEILKIDNKSADAHYGMGTILVRKKNLEKAITEFETAAKMNPYFTSVRADLVKAYEEKKEYKKALATYDELAKIVKTDNFYRSVIHTSKGKIYERMGQKSKAKAEYEKALELNKNNLEAAEALKK